MKLSEDFRERAKEERLDFLHREADALIAFFTTVIAKVTRRNA